MNVPSTFVHDCSLDLPTDKFFFNLITGWRQGFNRIHGSRASSMNNWMILVVNNTFFTHIANCNELSTRKCWRFCTLYSEISSSLQQVSLQRTTAIFTNTISGHLRSCRPTKPIPSKLKVIIALVIAIVSVVEALCSYRVIQVAVVIAF